MRHTCKNLAHLLVSCMPIAFGQQHAAWAQQTLALSFCYPVSPIGPPGSGQIICPVDDDPIPRTSTYYLDQQSFLELNDTFGKYHLGEDWSGDKGGSTDLGDPVYAVADGVVRYVKDQAAQPGAPDSWGKVVVIQHSLVTGEQVYSLYAHLDYWTVPEICGASSSPICVVRKGQKIGAIGDANGYYQNAAHLHLEIRKTFSYTDRSITPGHGYIADPDDPFVDANYYWPTHFIETHRLETCTQAGSDLGDRSLAVSCPPPADTTPPDTTIIGGPSGATNSSNASFSWTGSDDSTPTSSLVYAFRLDPVDSGYSTFGSATTHSYSNLSNGNYTFYVKARDQAGNEDPSPATRSFTVASGAAPSVASVAASEVSMTDGYLNAFVNPNGSPTNVFFQYGLTSNYGLTTPSKSLGMGTGTLAASWNVTGLSCHTTYNFRAAATNAHGTNYGDNLSFTTSACGTTPTPPAVITAGASNVTANSATVNASVNPEGKSTSYHFEYGTSTSYGLSTSSQSLAGDSNSHAVSFALSGLTCGTLYDFRAVASNADGTNSGNNQSFVTDPCGGGGTAAPTVTTRPADGIDIADANLESTVNPNGEDTYLFFEYGLGTDYGSVTPSRHIGAGTTNIGIGTRITGLPCSTLYNFRAVATNADGTARGDNLTFSTASCGVDRELVNGVSRTDSVSSPVASGAWNFYYITVPQDAVQLHVYVANLSGDVLVLANSGSKPLFTAFSCEGAIGGTDPRRCTVENPTPGVWWIGVSNLDTGTITYTVTATVAESSGSFFTLPPCRIVDSRNGPRGSLGGSSGVNTPITEICGIPATATAVSLNVTATRPSSAGFISVTDAVGLPASTSTVNFSRGQTHANNAIVRLTADGTVAVYCGGMSLSDSVDFILDTNGYFVDQRPLVGVWRGTFASYTAELDIEKNGYGFMAQFSAAGNPKTDMTILSASNTDFDALRPSDGNAEVRLSLTTVGAQSCLVGGYIESGTTRPVSVCLVE